VIPLEFARYVLLHPEKDPQWREHARRLVEWVKTTPKWPKYIVHGATVTTEQGNGKEYCCNRPNQCCDSHSARLAAVEALYYAKTGDPSYKEAAYRTYNWVTYFQGLAGAAHAPFSTQWWFTDEFSDGPRRMMDAFWAVPEWAPSDESHLLGGLSAVTKISYGAGRVTYSTFDAESTDVLRLDFSPDTVTSGGKPLERRQDLAAEGFTFDPATKVLRIRHTSSRDIDIQGQASGGPVSYVTFDDPHRAARTVLNGPYPAGIMEWPANQWEIATPEGKFPTFHVLLKDREAPSAEFQLSPHHIFLGLDVYNEGTKDATIELRSPEVRELTVTVKPGELRRFRTGWRDPSSQVLFRFENGQGLRFDNLAFSRE
jgi:hypothetical protein